MQPMRAWIVLHFKKPPQQTHQNVWYQGVIWIISVKLTQTQSLNAPASHKDEARAGFWIQIITILRKGKGV